ncbi:MAG: carboxypeptidase regulatory-like domain-containing protein [Planctomycetes bacterium]|nr:carboxypeptidase regulatory-like domain-containing protein [Planctomycetota bacterium]
MRQVLLALAALALAVALFVVWRGVSGGPRPAEPAGPGPAAPGMAVEPGAATAGLAPAQREPERRVEPSRAMDAPDPSVSQHVRLTGRVVDGTARPLLGVEVQLAILTVRAPDGATKGVGSLREPQARATSAGDGSFSFVLAPPSGTVPVRALLCAGGDGLTRVQAWTEIPEGPPQVQAEDLVLERATTLRGVVLDTAGAPAAGARVQARAERGAGHWLGVGTAVTSGADGGFAIDDAPSGRLQLAARSQDEVHGDPLELQLEPGEVRAGLVLVVPVRDDASAVSGVVLDLDGKPLAGAVLHMTSSTPRGGGASTSGRRSDEHGRFRFVGTRDSRFEIAAAHPHGETSPALARDVPAGTHGLELRLVPLVTSELLVVGSLGAPIERFAFRLHVERNGVRRVESSSKLAERPAGRAAFALPAEPFTIAVDAPGFASREVGPFDPGQRLTPYQVALDPVPALVGRVVRGTEPVPGALVRAQRALEPGQSIEIGGFDARAAPCDRCPVTKSDQDGRFALDVPSAGAWLLRAESQGAVSALAGPAPVVSGARAAEVVIDLAPAGSLEGFARSSAGRPLPHRRVGASNGDADVRLATTDERGAYRFEGLAAGPWQVRLVASDFSPRPGQRETQRRGEDAPPIAWDCQVAAGRTTRHDLVEEAPVELVVLVRDASARFPPAAWSLRAAPADPRSKLARAQARAGEDGSFHLRLERAGRWRVTAEVAQGVTRAQLALELEVTADGQQLSVALGRGAVQGRVAGVGAGAQVVLTGVATDGVRVWASTSTRDGGEFEFPFGFDGDLELDLPGAEGRVLSVRARADERVDAGSL